MNVKRAPVFVGSRVLDQLRDWFGGREDPDPWVSVARREVEEALAAGRALDYRPPWTFADDREGPDRRERFVYCWPIGKARCYRVRVAVEVVEVLPHARVIAETKGRDAA